MLIKNLALTSIYTQPEELVRSAYLIPPTPYIKKLPLRSSATVVGANFPAPTPRNVWIARGRVGNSEIPNSYFTIPFEVSCRNSRQFPQQYGMMSIFPFRRTSD